VEEIRQKVLVSNSDAHSPANLGRELTVLETNEKFSFPLLSKILQEGYQSPAGQISTVEFYPEEGKYHFDGHRVCKVRFSPEQTKKADYLCPECGRYLTVGVLHRVESLAKDSEPITPEGAKFLYTVPLRELIAQTVYTAPSSKKVDKIYQKVTAEIPEIDYLLEAEEPDLIRAGNEQLAQAVLAMRAGEVERIAGYDGEYGIIKVRQKPISAPQGSLF